MGCRRSGRGSNRKANVVRSKLDTPATFAMGLRNRQEPLRRCPSVRPAARVFNACSVGGTSITSPSRPLRYCILRRNPFAARQFSAVITFGSCLPGQLTRKEPRIEPSWAKWRRDPTTDESEIICIEMQFVVLKQLQARTFDPIPDHQAAKRVGLSLRFHRRVQQTPTSSNNSRAAPLIIAAVS